MALSLSSSSASATVAVDKATSDLLMSPDWTMNIDICDSVNSHHWQAKDVVKAVKKRLQHKNPRVQLLSLTLLETMVKNCGDYVHFQIAEKKILEEMIKIVKKKTDMQVREKILALLDSWQEAFGGPGGKYPQYYMAYEELRRSGVEFPKRSVDASPIFTPPVTHPTLNLAQPGYGMPSNSSRRLDETMATEIESLSLSSMDSMRNIMELLSDMLQAVNPSDRAAIRDEVIVDLVNRCRSNQKKLMQMLTTTGDEELLGQGLELNDSLQSLLAKHDAIASGSPLPTLLTNSSPQPTEAGPSSPKPSEAVNSRPRDSSLRPNAIQPTLAITRAQLVEEEEEEDEFAQLARRHSKTQPMPFQSTGTTEGQSSMDASSTSTTSSVASSTTLLALALPDPPSAIRTTKEQEMIDLLSITLSTASASPHAPHTPLVSNQNMHQIPVSPSAQGYPYGSQTYPGNQGQVPYNSYVVPWAQPQQLQPQSFQQVQPQPRSQPQVQPQLQPQSSFHQFQPQPQPQPQLQPQSFHQFQPQLQPQSFQQVHPHHQPQPQLQPQLQPQPQPRPQLQPQLQPQSFHQVQPQPQLQPQPQPQLQPQPEPQLKPQSQPLLEPQLQSQSFQQVQSQPQPQPQPNPRSQPQLQPQNPQYLSAYPPPPWAPTPGYSNNQNHASASYTPTQGARPLQHYNSFPFKGINGSAVHGDPRVNAGPKYPAPAAGPKPFVPTYRLFEDLNVFGNVDGKLKTTSSSASSSLSGSPGQSMVGGRK